MDYKKEREALIGRAESAEMSLKEAQATLERLRSQFEESETKAQSLQSELDDLLLVLGELEEKQTRYTAKIKSLNGQITDEEEEG